MLKFNSSKKILSLILSFTVLTSSFLTLPTLKASALPTKEEQIQNLKDFCYNKGWYAENTWFSIVHYMENGGGHTIAKHVFDYSNQNALRKRLADIKKKQVCKLIDEDIRNIDNELIKVKNKLLEAALAADFDSGLVATETSKIRKDILNAYIESWVNCKLNGSDSPDISSAKTDSQHITVTFPLRFFDESLEQDDISNFVSQNCKFELDESRRSVKKGEYKLSDLLASNGKFMTLFEAAMKFEIKDEKNEYYSEASKKREESTNPLIKKRLQVFKVIDTKLNKDEAICDCLENLNNLKQEKYNLNSLRDRFLSGDKYDQEMTAYVNKAIKGCRFDKTAVTMFKNKNDAEAVVKEFLKRNMTTDIINTYREHHQNSEDKIRIGINETNEGIIEWLESDSNASFSGVIEYKENINKAGCRLSRFIQQKDRYNNEFNYDESNKYVVFLLKNETSQFGFTVITCYPVFNEYGTEDLAYSSDSEEA